MAPKNYQETAENIVKHFGGKENIGYLNHCATRLRINPVDKDKVDFKSIEKTSGVLGVEDNGSEVQVIIGQAVEQLYPEVQKLVGKTNGTAATRRGGARSQSARWPRASFS